MAFRAEDRDTVDAFHAAALGAGAVDNGAPGPRPRYHPDYYGGFVIDPDGNNVEAVCHEPRADAIHPTEGPLTVSPKPELGRLSEALQAAPR